MLFVLALAAFVWWTRAQTRQQTADGRQEIILWGSKSLGEELYNVVERFERLNPEYKVTMSTAAARDLTGDAQRLMCAIAGKVPPDVVFFDRFAVGEWAARGAFLDLRPMLEAQGPKDPFRIDLSGYYQWAVEVASYAPPGSNQTPGIFGIPTNVDVRGLLVNGDVLRQAGLVDERGNPQPPRTWEELRDCATRLTVYRTPGDKRSGIVRLGFSPSAVGNSALYLYSWQAGGEFMNAQRTRVTMDAPPVVRALRWMADVCDELGGVGQVEAFQQSQQGGDLDPFLNGRLAMKIDGEMAMEGNADWRPTMDFLFVAPPIPADELAKGHGPVTWSGGFAWVIPATSRQKDGAFKLVQFLASETAVRMLERGKREQKESEGRIYLPRAYAERRVYEALLRESIDENPDVPETFKRAFRTVRELMPHSRVRPVTPVGQLLWNQHMRAHDAGVRHHFRAEAQASARDEYELALTSMQRGVQEQLDRLLSPSPARVVNWTPIVVAYALIVVAPFAALFVAYKRRRREYGYKAREVGAAMLFISPWVIGFVFLVGGPFAFSIALSFTRWDVLSPARAVGMENYREVLSDPVFYTSLLNTAYMVLQVPLGMAVSLAIALLLNRAIRGIGAYRAAFYLPVVMPIVATSILWIWLLNPSFGLINAALSWLYGTPIIHGIEWLISRFTSEPFTFGLPLWLQDPSWSKPSLILMNLWKAGGGMIIWLAGLQSIPGELYEAASIDGAGPWRRFKNITLPMLSPFILFNLIIGLIGTMQIFSEAFIMTAGGPVDSTLFYAYYLFKQAFQFFRMGYASALAWILFVIILALTLVQLWLSRRWVHYENA